MSLNQRRPTSARNTAIEPINTRAQLEEYMGYMDTELVVQDDENENGEGRMFFAKYNGWIPDSYELGFVYTGDKPDWRYFARGFDCWIAKKRPQKSAK